MTTTAPDLTPGTHIETTTPMGVRRVVRIDQLHENGLITLSYPLPRGKGRRVWVTERRWLTSD